MSGASSCVVLIHCEVAACLALRDSSCASADVSCAHFAGCGGFGPTAGLPNSNLTGKIVLLQFFGTGLQLVGYSLNFS